MKLDPHHAVLIDWQESPLEFIGDVWNLHAQKMVIEYFEDLRQWKGGDTPEEGEGVEIFSSPASTPVSLKRSLARKQKKVKVKTIQDGNVIVEVPEIVPDVKPMEEVLREYYPPEDVIEAWNKDFVKGKHLSWQQYCMLVAVEDALMSDAPDMISVCSGVGIGKTTTMAWLLLWHLFCFRNCKVGCTAPTGDQLYDILWSEVALWLNKMPEPLQAEYHWQSEYVKMRDKPESWYARARTSRKEKPEALSGLHAPEVLILVDEASAIEDIIFKTMHGALTSPRPIIFMISNPTRNTGYFYDTHHKNRHLWQTLSFSSLESPVVGEKVELIRLQYGEEGIEWNMRVLGKFPDADMVDSRGYTRLFDSADVRRRQDMGFTGRKRLGVDPSGMGADSTVYVVRDAFQARIVRVEEKSSPEKIAMVINTLMTEFEIPAEEVFIDIFGVGAETWQKLMSAGIPVIGVDVGRKPNNEHLFLNLRAEAYWRMREWVKGGGEFVDHKRWDELDTIMYRKTVAGSKIQIMSKLDMRRKGIASPDSVDACAITFSEPMEDVFDNTDSFEEYVERPFGGRLG
jgi:hypothetical protein